MTEDHCRRSGTGDEMENGERGEAGNGEGRKGVGKERRGSEKRGGIGKEGK